jgi:hypothetical protein
MYAVKAGYCSVEGLRGALRESVRIPEAREFLHED